MTTYYVGSGGSDANAGTSWALRKLTLNGAEDIPVAAGDVVYVGPGVYRLSRRLFGGHVPGGAHDDALDREGHGRRALLLTGGTGQ